MNFHILKEKIELSPVIDFSRILSDSFDLFKKAWLQGFLLLVLIMASVFFVQFAAILPFTLFLEGSNFIEPFKQTDFSNFSSLAITIVAAIFIIVVILLLMTLLVGLLGGFYIVLKNIDLEDTHSTNDFFTLLRTDKFIKTFKVATAQIGISIIFILMCYIPIIYATIPISYIIVIYAFNPELSVREIIKLAFNFGNKNWVQTFLLRLIVGFVAMLGIFLCGFGILFTYSLTLIPAYFSYKEVIGFETTDDIDEIGSVDTY